MLVKHVMTVLGQPLQWLIGENLSAFVLKPMLEQSGFSRKSCPSVLFETPDVVKKDVVEQWVNMVAAGIQTPEQACEHMKLDYDEKYWKEKERKEQEQLLAGKVFGAPAGQARPSGQGNPQDKGNRRGEAK